MTNNSFKANKSALIWPYKIEKLFYLLIKSTHKQPTQTKNETGNRQLQRESSNC